MKLIYSARINQWTSANIDLVEAGRVRDQIRSAVRESFRRGFAGYGARRQVLLP